jgi:hypothetical protein
MGMSITRCRLPCEIVVYNNSNGKFDKLDYGIHAADGPVSSFQINSKAV